MLRPKCNARYGSESSTYTSAYRVRRHQKGTVMENEEIFEHLDVREPKIIVSPDDRFDPKRLSLAANTSTLV
jgi:hypothetical protein